MSTDNVRVELSETDVDVVNLHKMLFIYNAVLSGWTVKKMPGKDEFEFTKNLDNNTRREINLMDYLRRFVLANLNIDNIKP